MSTNVPVDLAYVETGSGDPLVLIMGLGADRTAWDLHVDVYRTRFRCIAVDNRGAGASAKPAGPYTTAALADDYARLIRSLGLSAVRVVGISMGGAIAQELALRHPGLVDRMVLVSTWARCDAYGREIFEMFARARARVAPADFVQLLQLWIWSRRYVDANLADLLAACQGESLMPQYAFEAQCAACIGHDASARLGQIAVPTLITAGDQDIFTPLALAEELHSGIPGSELKVFPGAGHAHHWEELDAFNRATLDWLAR